MDNKIINKLQDKVVLIEKIESVTDFNLYNLIAEYCDILYYSKIAEPFLKELNSHPETLESKNALNSYNEIKFVYEIITSVDEPDYHERDLSEAIGDMMLYMDIKNLRNKAKLGELSTNKLKLKNFKFHLLNFHSALRDFLGLKNREERNEKLTYKSKKIYISKAEGIFINPQERKPNYPISGKRAELLWQLRDGVVSGPELCEQQEQELPILSQEIKRINKKFRECLSLDEDLIVHQETGGYKLNDIFEVEFLMH